MNLKSLIPACWKTQARVKPYSLLLVGAFNSPRSNVSAEFFSEELFDRFAKLPHVTLRAHHFCDEAYPVSDVALVHGYSDTPAVRGVAKLKQRVGYTAWFMETYDAPGFDHYWFYNPDMNRDRADVSFVPAPVVGDYYRRSVKLPGSLLLDHDLELFPAAGNPEFDWNRTLWAVLERYRSRFSRICQLARGPCPQRPDWIEVLPVQSHQDYLAATAGFESFVCTHAGSYNHSAVDMAVRGTRVIVPSAYGRTFVPRQLTADLHMELVHSPAAAIEACLQPQWAARAMQTTDLEDVVRMMDQHFQGVL